MVNKLITVLLVLSVLGFPAKINVSVEKVLLAEILKTEKQMLPLVGKCHWNKSRKADWQVIA